MADRRPAGNGLSANSDGAEERQSTESKAVDVDQLADRVYRLMLTEARLERARRGHG